MANNSITEAVKVRFIGGTSIREAVIEAIELAHGGAERVFFNFNGVNMLITKDSNIAEEVAFWQKCSTINGIKI